jgi:Tfp pilus assembly protein PilO
MTPEMIWSAVLTFAISVAGWFMKGNADELKRLQILLNRTREELAKEYVTKAEVHADINRVITRIDNLDAKIERLLERLVK